MYGFRIINTILNLFKNTTVVKQTDKVLSNVGFIGSMERTHVDTFTENRIKNIKGKLIASSNFGKIWFHHQELGGFHILNTTILSGTNIKSNKGSVLLFQENENTKLILTSDEKGIKSDFSNVSNLWITEISYDLSEVNRIILSELIFDEIQLNYKNRFMLFQNLNKNISEN